MGRASAFLLLAALAACVPEGPASGDGASAAAPRPAPAPKPRPANTAQPRGDAAVAKAGALITSTFTDDFQRAELGPDWNALGKQWRIDNGRLCARGAKNRGIWLMRRLPVNARVEFDAVAESPEGDIKAELWGDGQSGATGSSYSNATSYLTIFGGWRNTKHVLARLDEHGEDRLELDVDPNSDDERARPASPGQPYRFAIERRDGHTVTWTVNGVDYFELDDAEPLSGEGHEHLGFNDWEAAVCFDNVKIEPR
jgi:hypothetical protein